MRASPLCFIFFFVFYIAGCASSGNMASSETSSPVAGMWDYSINSPEGVFTGNLEIIPQEAGLAVHIIQEDQQEGDSIVAESVEFVVDSQTLTFSFENPEYGRMNVSLTLDERGNLNGILHAVQFTIDLPMVVTPSEM